MRDRSFIVSIAAGGTGRRIGADIPKQYLTVAGKPVLAHTLAVFDSMPECLGIVIATDDRPRLESHLSEYPVSHEVRIVDGGPQRQDSVANTLTECGSDDAVVLIHDAARPCVTEEEIRLVLDAVLSHGAALLALQARDTVKEAEGGLVSRTIDRARVWLAQTPQGARAGLWREAFRKAYSEGYYGTDDVELLERMGKRVALVPGSSWNLKITSPEDLPVAEAILRSMKAND